MLLKRHLLSSVVGGVLPCSGGGQVSDSLDLCSVIVTFFRICFSLSISSFEKVSWQPSSVKIPPSSNGILKIKPSTRLKIDVCKSLTTMPLPGGEKQCVV